MEVSIEEALEVAECTVVGRARGKKLSPGFIQEWGEKNWSAGQERVFEASTLVKGWFMLRFKNKEAADWVCSRNWVIGNIPVLMKKWTPLLDAVHEETDTFPVWVRAPGLPSFLWTESVFKAIGDRLGNYLGADMSFLETRNRAMARILVCLKPVVGLAKKINLQYRDFVFEQILDYEYLPFRCHRCHEYGHLAKECPLGRRRRRYQRVNMQWESDYNPSHHAQGKEPPSEKAPAVTETAAQKEQMSDSVTQDLAPSAENKELDREISLAKAELPEGSTLPSDGAMGMCIDPSSPPLHNSDSMDLCLDMSNTCTHDHSNNIDRTLKSDEKPDGPGIEDLSAAMPSLDLNSDRVSLEPGPSTVFPPCPYNLRSLDNKPITSVSVGGIGSLPSHSQSRKKRGRKSNLSMAQLKAKFDVADGKQQSITVALRAAQAPEEVIK